MKLVHIGTDLKEIRELQHIDTLSNVWFYKPEEELAVYLGLLILSNNELYFLKRYTRADAFSHFLEKSKTLNVYDSFLEICEQSMNFPALDSMCKTKSITLETEKWDLDEDPTYQMYYPESPLYCLEPISGINWVSEIIDKIPLPDYKE